MSDVLRKVIRELIEAELEEVTTTGDAEGYATPSAFAGNSNKARKHRKDVAQVAGYTLSTNQDLEGSGGDFIGETAGGGAVNEAATRYHGFKSDPTMSEAQKIGRSIQEINRQLAEMNRVVRMAARLKTETQTPQTGLWKRTAKHVARMEERLMEIQNALRELRS